MTSFFSSTLLFRLANCLLAVAMIGVFCPFAQGAVATWDGSIDANWASTSGVDSNWAGGLGTNGRPATSDSLVFTSATGIGGTTLVDNLMTPGTFNVAAITFNAGSPAYTINPNTGGTNGFTLTGNIINSSTNLQAINDLITSTAVRTITMTAAGGNVVLGGNISGTGGGITTAGAGALTLSGTNSYTANTTVNAVTLNIGSNSALGTGTLVINNAGAVLDATGGNRTLGNAVTLSNSFAFAGTNNLTLGNATYGASRTITLNSTTGKVLTLGNLTQTSTSTTTLTVNGAGNKLVIGDWSMVAAGAGAATPTINGSGTVEITGTITNNGGAATQEFRAFGSGTIILSGNSTYTAITRALSGTLQLTGSLNPVSELLVGQSGAANGRFVLGGASGAVNQTFARFREAQDHGTLNVVVGGANSISILTDNTAVTDNFHGIIGGAGPNENNIGITKANIGTLNLFAANTYNGPTTVQGGTLNINGQQTGTGATSITGGTLAVIGTGSINGTSGITINGSGAKLLYTSSTPMASTVPIALSAGTVDGTSTIGALSVADDATGVVTNGNAGNSQLKMSSLSFAGDATVNTRSFAAALTPGIVVQGALSTNGAGGTVTINPTTTSGSWVVGNNPLIGYGSFSGSINDFTLGTITGALAGRQTAFGGLVNTGSSIALQVIGDLPKWTGLDNGNWVVGATGANSNWKLVTGGTATDYIEGDQVVFDDSATSATTLSGGTITVDINTATVSPTTTEFSNSSLHYTINSSSGSGIGGSGLLTKSGTGTLTLNTANSYTSGTLFTGGALILGTFNGNFGTLGNGPVTIAPGLAKTLDNTTGAPLTLTTTTQTWDDNFTFTGSNDLDMGSGAVALSGASRTITVNGSRLTVGGLSGGTTTALVVNGAGVLAISNSTVAGLSGTGGISNNAAANATLTVIQNADSVFNGALQNGTANIFGFTKQGIAKLTLTNANSAFSGTTTLSGGTLVMAHPDALGNSTTHTSRVNIGGDNTAFVFATDVDTSYALGFGLSSGNTATIVSDRATPGAAVDRTMTTPSGLGTGTINFTAGPNVTSGIGRITFQQFSLAAGSGTETIVNPTGVNLSLGDSSKTGSTPVQTLVLDGTTSGNDVFGVISNGAATISVAKRSTSTWTLTGNNTYTGTTTISGGTLNVGNGGGTGTLGTGAITNNATLNFNRSGTITVAAAVTGTGVINQIGSGTLAFTNSVANSVNVNSGTLDGTGSLGATTIADNAAIVLANGNGGTGTLTLNTLTFSGDATVNATKGLGTTPFTVTNALTTSANGPVTINGSGTWSSGVNNLIGFGSFNGSLSHFTVGSITGLSSRQTVGALALNGNNIALNIIGQVVTWTGKDDGNWSVGLNGTNKNWKVTSGPTDYLDLDEVLFDDTATGPTTIDLGSNVSPNITTFSNSSKNYTLNSASGFGILTGPLTKSGAGSLTINTANSYTLGTIFNGGTLNLGNAAAIGAGTLTIGSGTAKTLDNTSGGPLTLTGVTTQTWNDNFTFNGSNDLSMGAGAVTLGPATVAVTLQNSGTLTVGSIAGAGKVLAVNGPGTGALAIASSTLGGLSGNGTIENNSAAAATLTVDQSTDTTFSGILRNSPGGNTLTLSKAGTGTLTLEGASSYTGNTAIGNGAIVVKNSSAFGASALISFAATSTGTLEIALDPGSDIANQFTMNTGGNIVIKSGRLTPGAGTTHSLTNQVIGGGSVTIAKGSNVTSGTASIAFSQINMTAGTDNATTIFNPTDADVTIAKVMTGSVRPRGLTLDGTGNGTILNGIDGTNGPLTVIKSNTSTWTIAAGGNSTYAGTTTVSGGTLLINNTTNTGAVSVTAGGTLGGTGTISTSATSANVTVAAGGSLAPGASAGTLTFDTGGGSLDISSVTAGGLKFELGAPMTPGASDLVALTTGTLNIGTLDFSDFSLANLGGVAVGTYKLFDANSFITFSPGSASGTSGGITGTLSVENTTDFDVLLQVTSVAVPGDYNNDGKVNAADYVLWRKNPAAYGGNPAGYNTWRANFGNPPGAGSYVPGAGGAVPEPGTLALLCLSSIVFAAKRRIRRS